VNASQWTHRHLGKQLGKKYPSFHAVYYGEVDWFSFRPFESVVKSPEMAVLSGRKRCQLLIALNRPDGRRFASTFASHDHSFALMQLVFDHPAKQSARLLLLFRLSWRGLSKYGRVRVSYCGRSGLAADTEIVVTAECRTVTVQVINPA
jgi:hypothetical protein